VENHHSDAKGQAKTKSKQYEVEIVFEKIASALQESSKQWVGALALPPQFFTGARRIIGLIFDHYKNYKIIYFCKKKLLGCPN
jgi:hypothetical protein